MAINDSRRTNHASFPALDALLLLVILNFTLQPLTEPDFGWHLRTGLDLLTQGWPLPATDPYSHTMPDWPWVEHAWLTDVLLGLIYEDLGTAGGLGVILFFSAVVTGACLVASAVAPVAQGYRLVSCVIVLWAALPFLGARTQMITLLGVAVVMWVCEGARGGQVARLWILPPLFLLWANLHGGFTTGLALLGLVITGSVAVRLLVTVRPDWRRRIDEPIMTWALIQRLSFVTGLAGVLTLANPYGYRLFQEILTSLADQQMTERLHEWQPISLATVAGKRYATYLFGLGVAAACWYRRIEPVRSVVLAFFLVTSLRHMRNIPLFLFVSLPLCAQLLDAGARRVLRWRPVAARAAKQSLLILTAVVALVLGMLGTDHLQRVLLSGMEPVTFFRGTHYPIEAIQWVRSHRDQVGTRLYNDYGHGGFLLWWLPGEKIFIDGRMPAWKIGDRRVFADYIALNHWDPPALGVLDKYRVDWVLATRGSPLEQALSLAEGWHGLYEDTKVGIYVRGSGP